jgi:predicted secreted acid phosphatase
MKNFVYSFKHVLNHNLSLYLSITFAFALLSCSPALVNLDTAKDRVAKYYESGEYAKELTEIISDAKEKFSKVEVTPNSAVVFDIDETVLDNYEAIKKIGFGYIPKHWDEWQQKAEAPAIPQVKDLYDFLLEEGFKIIFITGKKDYQYDATFKNLNSVGYTKFDTLIVRQKQDYKSESALFKVQKRRELTEKGYVVAGCVGDQLTDCEGDNCGIVVKLPNYLYIVK